jgi:hypothetical protein
MHIEPHHQAAEIGDERTSPSAVQGARGHGFTAEQPRLALGRAIEALVRCVLQTEPLLARGRIRQQADNVGRRVRFADGTSSEVHRETVIERPPPSNPAVLVVGLRLESELNTAPFAGFPGLISKLWLRHDQHSVYRGRHQWDDPELAVAYVRAPWWVLSLVSERSIHYAGLSGFRRDEMLRDLSVLETAPAARRQWWRPVGEGGRAA